MRRFFKLRYIRRSFFVLITIVLFYVVMKTMPQMLMVRLVIKILKQIISPVTFVFINDTFGETHEYIINTSGCKIPKLDPFHSSIKHFIQRLPELNCTTSDSESYVYLENNVLRLLPDVNRSRTLINCTIKSISRRTDDEIEIGEQYPISDNGRVVTSEFTHVECTKPDDDDVVYNDFLPIIKHKQDVEKRIQSFIRKKHKTENPKFSVVLLGLDSVSKNQFLRHMLRTHSFMKSKLTFIELYGYNKIGPNTYSNMVPMLTGKLPSEVPDTSEVPVDVLPLIWKEYMANGYRTQFSEDFPQGSIFNYARKGFNVTPVDYYLRPFSLALESYIDTWRTGCLNNNSEADVIFQWMKDFMDIFPGDPLFAFTFLTRLTHDYFNFLSYHDTPVHNFISHLYLKGHFNNTVMFFFGDHGFRFGEFRSTYVGRMEGRLPFMFIIVPPWFPKTYPLIYENLKTNEKRLTTPLDIYATLKDLLYFNGTGFRKEDGRGRSISLMRYQVPEDRTCDDAHIRSQWCSCFHRDPVPVNDSNVVLCARNIVRKINAITSIKRDQCAEFALTEVLNASTRVVGLGENITGDGLTNYLVTLQVTPSNGIFEGSIWYDGDNVFTVEDTIERVNLYGNQSVCVDVNVLKPYCYCKGFEQHEKT